MDPATDFITLAGRLERDAFVAECPFPFLMAANRVAAVEVDDPFAADTSLTVSASPAPPGEPAGRVVVLPVRKVHSIIPHGIILGRASTSDIVLTDHRVSKTHAMFQQVDAGWEISDAGSRNGTWVGSRKLVPRSEAAPLHSGDILSFGYCAFFFVDAADCWDRIRGER